MWFGSGGKQDQNGKDPTSPWFHIPSLYSYIKENIDPVTGFLREKTDILPDHQRRFANMGFSWAPGLPENGPWELNTAPELGEHVASLVIEIASRNSNAAKLNLYELLIKDNVLTFFNLSIEKVIRETTSPYPHLHDFMVTLARNAPDRGPVKFAIAWLGLIKNVSDSETVFTLGRHEEFTFYTAAALCSMLKDPYPDLWDLAKKTHGYGKIQLIRRLASTNSPEIKAWLLREGYRISVPADAAPDIYLISAKEGNLKSALSAEAVDEGLLDSSAEIIQGLISSPWCLENYEDTAEVTSQYLNHVKAHAQKPNHQAVLKDILKYVDSDNCNWNDDLRASARMTIKELTDVS